MAEEKVKIKDEGKGAERIPDYKKKIVDGLAEKIKSSKTVLIASIKGLPGGQFHQIKKKLRGTAEIQVVKKSLLKRAIEKVEKGPLQNLKKTVGADIVVMFSNLDAFELSGILTENQSSAKAKAGDIAPEDIKAEEGPTDLIPGPAISELGAVGLKVAVENGKLAIKKEHVLVKEGEEINEKVAGVLAKLGITPMKVGYEPVAAYSSEDNKVYTGIKIDKEGTLEALREAIGKSLNLSVNIGYINPNNVSYFIAKAGMEGKVFEKLLETPVDTAEPAKDETSEEEKPEEPSEEKKEPTTEESKESVEGEKKEVKDETQNQDEKEESK